MRMKNPCLLTGPYDWNAELLPPDEYQSRLSRVANVLAEQRVNALIVHGNSLEYGALAYLTSFVPKLGPAFALIEREGPIRLLVAGSGTMLPAAKRLTWVTDVRPIGDLKTSLSQWFGGITAEDEIMLGLWGDDQMSFRAAVAIQAAIQQFGRIVELQAALDSLRVEKSPRERELLRRATGIVDAASETFLRASTNGSGVRSAALAAEHSAFEKGAQDVRVLASARDGGPPLAFDGPSDPVVSPVIACIAVKFAGYWAEGFVTSVSGCESFVRAHRTLAMMIATARAGVTSRELESLGQHDYTSHYKPHPFISEHAANSVGLTLDEASGSEKTGDLKLRIGGVYTLRAGAAGEGRDNAIVSATIAVNQSTTEILWSSPDAKNELAANRESQ